MEDRSFEDTYSQGYRGLLPVARSLWARRHGETESVASRTECDPRRSMSYQLPGRPEIVHACSPLLHGSPERFRPVSRFVIDYDGAYRFQLWGAVTTCGPGTVSSKMVSESCLW